MEGDSRKYFREVMAVSKMVICVAGPSEASKSTVHESVKRRRGIDVTGIGKAEGARHDRI